MPINTDTPHIYPPTANDMQDDEWAAGPAPPVDYETSPDAYKGEPAGEEMEDFASKAMGKPSRYDSDLIKDITAQIDAELEQKKLYAGTELDEFMSQRGMVGSSVEGELRKSMLGDMERQRQERLNELNIRAADAWAEDRAGAAEIGFKSAEFQRALGGDKENAARFEAEFGQSQYEFDAQYGADAWRNRIEERRLDLMEEGMDRDDAYRMSMAEIQVEQFAETLGEARAERVQRYGLDMGALENETRRIENEETGLSMQAVRDKAEINLRLEQLKAQKEESQETFEVERERIMIQNEQFKDRLNLDQTMFEEQRTARIAQIGLSSRELDQAAERLQLDAVLQGRSLDLQEARSLAEIEHRTRELSQTMGLEQARLQAQETQFQAQHSQNRQQWADSLGLERDQYEEAVNARHAEYEDRRGARLDQMDLQEGTLEHEAMQNSLSRSLEREALQLQRMGMDEETAWRAADRKQEARLQDRALDLQREGLNEETAWRQAVNDSNERMQDAQIASEEVLLRLGLNSESSLNASRELHEQVINNANIASAEKIDELAREMQKYGIDAETAIRAATDAANEAMTNANNNARYNLETYLQSQGISAAETAAATNQTFQLALDVANNGSREAIQDKVSETIGSQLASETAWRLAQREHEEKLQSADHKMAGEEHDLKKYATETDLKLREHEFATTTTENRIKMVLAAFDSENFDQETMEAWVDKYPPPETTDESIQSLRADIEELNGLMSDQSNRIDELAAYKSSAEVYIQWLEDHTTDATPPTGDPPPPPDRWTEDNPPPGWNEGWNWDDDQGWLNEDGIPWQSVVS